MSVKFIHTADIHIGMKFSDSSLDVKTAALRRKEIKETFFRILDRARDNNVDFLFIAGDLFENEYITPGELREIAGALAAIDPVRVIIIAGNHDPAVAGAGYARVDFPANVFIAKGMLNGFSFEEAGTDIYAAGWNERYMEEPVLESIKITDESRINILVAHCDIYSAVSRYLPADRESLKSKGFDYIALGHIHKYDSVPGDIVYPGSPEPLDFSESGRHGIVEGTIDRGVCIFSFIPFAKREFRTIKFTITPDMTKKVIIEKLKGIIIFPEDLYRILLEGVYDPELDIDEEELRNELEDSCFYAEIINRAEEDIDIERISDENKDNVIGRFIKEMKKSGDDEALKAGLMELLRYRRG